MGDAWDFKSKNLNEIPIVASAAAADYMLVQDKSSGGLKRRLAPTVTQAEVQFLDGATAGTQVASKAVIADSNVNTGISKVTQLHIGATGSETQVNATAAEINKACDESTKLVTEEGDTLTVTAALHAGRIIAFGKTDGTEVTLPAATGTGNIYRFIISITATSSANKISVANSTDVFDGGLCFQQDTDADGTVKCYRADVGDDTMTFAGAATTGGIKGGQIDIVDYKSGFFSVRAYTQSGGGSEVTPFSAAV